MIRKKDRKTICSKTIRKMEAAFAACGKTPARRWRLSANRKARSASRILQPVGDFQW